MSKVYLLPLCASYNIPNNSKPHSMLVVWVRTNIHPMMYTINAGRIQSTGAEGLTGTRKRHTKSGMSTGELDVCPSMAALRGVLGVPYWVQPHSDEGRASNTAWCQGRTRGLMSRTPVLAALPLTV